MSIIKAYLWQAIAGILALALIAAGWNLWAETERHSKTREDRDRISLAFSKYQTEQIELHATKAREARENERKLQAAADELRKDSNAKINRLRRDLYTALDSLRERPQRPVASANGLNVPSATGSGTDARGCTASELYREDAEVAYGIAYDAEQLRIEFQRIWGLYERARSQTQKLGE